MIKDFFLFSYCFRNPVWRHVARWQWTTTLEVCVSQQFCPNLRYYSCVCLVGQREVAKNLGQN